MKKYAALILFLIFYTTKVCSAQEIISELIAKWKNAKEYTLKIADAMPDSAYNFKPTETEMSFSEQLKHLTDNLLWLHEDFILPSIKSKSGELRGFLKNAKTKPEIIDALGKSFDFVIAELSESNDANLRKEVILFGNKKTRRQVCLLAIDHLAHHRGQCIVYLRLKGIAPPGYKGY